MTTILNKIKDDELINSTFTFRNSLTPWCPEITDENYNLMLDSPTIKYATRLKILTHKVTPTELLKKIIQINHIEFDSYSLIISGKKREDTFKPSYSKDDIRIDLLDQILRAKEISCAGILRNTYLIKAALSHKDPRFAAGLLLFSIYNMPDFGASREDVIILLKRLFSGGYYREAFNLALGKKKLIGEDLKNSIVNECIIITSPTYPKDKKTIVEELERIYNEFSYFPPTSRLNTAHFDVANLFENYLDVDFSVTEDTITEYFINKV